MARRAAGGGPEGPVPGTTADPPAGADPESVARVVALRLLAAAPRTRAQLARALARRGVPDEVAASVLDRFEQVDLIDDTEFARSWVSSRHTGRGLAPRALAQELRSRGVAEETVRAAVDEIGPEQELESARALVRRRSAAMAADDPARRTRRLVGMLARKGYGHSVALRAIRDVTGEHPEEPAPE
jgi:regulatory protein